MNFEYMNTIPDKECDDKGRVIFIVPTWRSKHYSGLRFKRLFRKYHY